MKHLINLFRLKYLDNSLPTIFAICGYKKVGSDVYCFAGQFYAKIDKGLGDALDLHHPQGRDHYWYWWRSGEGLKLYRICRQYKRNLRNQLQTQCDSICEI